MVSVKEGEGDVVPLTLCAETFPSKVHRIKDRRAHTDGHIGEGIYEKEWRHVCGAGVVLGFVSLSSDTALS